MGIHLYYKWDKPKQMDKVAVRVLLVVVGCMLYAYVHACRCYCVFRCCLLFWGMIRTGIISLRMIGSQLFEMFSSIRLYSHIDVGCSIIAFNTLQLEFNLFV